MDKCECTIEDLIYALFNRYDDKESISNILPNISKALDKISASNDTSEDISSLISCITENSLEILQILYPILYEIRKTNVLLERMEGKKDKENIVLSDDMLGKNIIIEVKDSVFSFKKKLESRIGPGLKVKVGAPTKAVDFAALLTNLEDGDYLIIDATRSLLFDEASEMLTDYFKSRSILFPVGREPTRGVRMSIEDIHVIIFTEFIEMIDPRLIDAVDMVITQ